MRRAAGVLAVASSLAVAGAGGHEAPPVSEPHFTSDGALMRPEGYREWVFVGASLGLGYGAHADGPQLFHNVYLQRAAYDEFRRGRGFPDGTVLVLELFQPETRAIPARHGSFEGERVALEAAVKDTKRFDGGWAYFSFEDGNAGSARAFPRASCAACHREHAATDNVFTQFYPVLRAAAR